jgi:hypothetical protein
LGSSCHPTAVEKHAFDIHSCQTCGKTSVWGSRIAA